MKKKLVIRKEARIPYNYLELTYSEYENNSAFQYEKPLQAYSEKLKAKIYVRDNHKQLNNL